MKIKTLIKRLEMEDPEMRVEYLVCKITGEVVTMELTKKTSKDALSLLKSMNKDNKKPETEKC